MTRVVDYSIPVYELRLHRVRDIGGASRRSRFDNPRALEPILHSYFEGLDREHFAVLLLDTKFHILGINTVSIGTLDTAIVHPREVFKPAILANASAIILAHNHPSGDPTPSEDDLQLTTRLQQAGDLLGIHVLDHIILGNYADSLKALGYID